MNEVLQLLDSLSTRLMGHVTIRSHDIGLEIRVHWKAGSYGKYFSRTEIKRARPDVLISGFVHSASKAHTELKKKQQVDKSKSS